MSEFVDWTRSEEGRSNSSAEFDRITGHVDRLIRESAFDLIAGRTNSVARLIMAQLAHEHGYGPSRSSETP